MIIFFLNIYVHCAVLSGLHFICRFFYVSIEMDRSSSIDPIFLLLNEKLVDIHFKYNQ